MRGINARAARARTMKASHSLGSRTMSANVLVPYDGSASAMRALAHAIETTRGRPGVVHLLNVEATLDDYGMVPVYLTRPKHREITMRRAQEVLAPAIARLKRARARHEVHVVWGEVAESIARTARRLKCRSIVMGTRGMGAAGNLLLGSAATKVVHLAKVPVTLVK